MLSSLQPPPGSAACPAPRRTEARDRHLQHRERLGHPDDHQEPDRGRVRRRRAADDAQARRGDHAAGGGPRRGAEAVRGLAGQDRRPGHDLRVPLAGSRRRPQEHRRDEGVGEAREGPRIAQRKGPPERTAQGRSRKKDPRADWQGAGGMRRVRARQRRRDSAGSSRPRDLSACRGSERSSTTAATIPACAPAGTRTRRTCSTAASTRTSGCSATRSARCTCATCRSRSIPGGS